MPRHQSETIVLRTYNIGEQDKIVTFFGRDRGLFKGVAKGARKFGNRFGSTLEPLSHITVFYYEKEGKDLVTVSSCDLIESFFELQSNLDVSIALSYFSELIEDARPLRSEDDILFRLLLLILQTLKTGGDLYFLTAYFEAWFLKINGFLPDLSRCKQCRQDIAEDAWLSPKKDGTYCNNCAAYKKEEISLEMTSFLNWIKKNPPTEIKNQTFTTQQIQSFHKILKDIIVFHMERAPKSLSFM